VVVAVATGMEGFTEIGGTIGALVFHAVTCAAGAHLIGRAAARSHADELAEAGGGTAVPAA
jgi:multisubunit Na+/H+ antiporter MnhG subunit